MAHEKGARKVDGSTSNDGPKGKTQDSRWGYYVLPDNTSILIEYRCFANCNGPIHPNRTDSCLAANTD